MDQDLAQIDVASLADAEQLRLASGGVLARYDTEPCCEVSSLAEGRAVADRGNNGGRHHGSDAWDLTDAGAARVCIGDTLQLFGKLLDLLLHGLPLTPQDIDGVAHLWCQVRVGVLEDVGHGGLSFAGVCANTMPRRAGRLATGW